jgi:hypothetical protein
MNGKKWYSVLGTAILLVSLAGCDGLQRAEFQPPTVESAKPWTDRPFKNDSKDFQFAIVSDRTGGCRPGVFKNAMLQVNLLQPEFVMCVGDLINGATEDVVLLNQEYEEIDRILESLEMRFFRVAGNHDISNSVMLDVYRERYELPYYHFVYKDALFLIVLTEDPPSAKISIAQVDYIRKALADNKNARWTFVFMHQPLFVEQEGELHPDWSKIENMLKDRPHSIFAGHHHAYLNYKKNGQSYIRLATTGAGSGLSGIKDGSFDHIVWVTMTDKGPRIANLLLDGIHDENIRVAE